MDYLSYNGSDNNNNNGGGRFFIMMAVIMLFFIGMSYMMPRPEVPPEAQKSSNDAKPAALEQAPISVKYEIQPRTLETDQISVSFTNVGGGRISSVHIKDPDRYVEHGEDGDFIRSQKPSSENVGGLLPLEVTLPSFGINPETQYTTVSNAEDHSTASFSYTDTSGKLRFDKTFTTTETPYVIHAKFQLTNMTAEPVSDSMAISMFIKQIEGEEPGIFQPGSYVAAKCHSDGDMKYVDATDKNESESFKTKLRWFAVDESYFAAAMTADYANSCEIRNDDGLLKSTIKVPVTLGVNQQASYDFEIFLGPKESKYLDAFGEDRALDDIIDYGWIEVLARPMAWILDKFHQWLGNWGLAIILLTLIVRGLLWPIAQKSQISMMRMSKIAPLMQQLQEQYKDNPQMLQQKQLELYREQNINPFGCLPLLLQMPIFFALYRCIFVTGGLYHAEFYLWIHDLSARDPFFILPLLSVGLLILQQLLTPQATKSKQQKIMLFAMPIIFGAMMLFLPAGLCLYMVVSSLFSMVQSFYVRHIIAKEDQPAAVAAGSNKAVDANDVIDVEVLNSKDRRAAKRRKENNN